VLSDCTKTHAANGLIPKWKVCQYSIAEDELNAEIEGPGNDDDEGDSSNSPSTLQNDLESMANILVDLAQWDNSEDDNMLPETQPTPT
jgi:hypothetical protein